MLPDVPADPALLDIGVVSLTEQEIEGHLQFVTNLKNELEKITPAQLLDENLFTERKGLYSNEPL